MDDFRTCSLHDAYHTGCIDCQHDMTEEISILKADNARMRGLLSELLKNGKEVKSYHPDNSGVAIIETTVDILADIAQLIKGEG